MEEPTKEQIKKFWKGCKVKPIPANNFFTGAYLGLEYPPIDPNNLFKYTEEPLVKHFIDTTNSEEEYRQAYYELLCKCLHDYIWNEPHDPALAFFQVLYPVIVKN